MGFGTIQMIYDLFGDWNVDQSRLLRADTRKREYEPVDVERAAERAIEFVTISAPKDDAQIVPLFAGDGPIPTPEYIVYRPGKSQVGWYDSGFGVSGTRRFTDAARLNDTIIGQRLRFWLPEHQPSAGMQLDESALPPEQINPASRLGKQESEEFIRDLKEFVRTERRKQRESNWEAYTELGFDEAITQNKLSSAFLQFGEVKTPDQGNGYRFQLLEDDDNETPNIRGDEGIFVGNRCILDAAVDSEQLPIPVEVLSISDPSLVVRPEWDRIGHRGAVERILNTEELEVRFHELLNPVPYDRRLDAISEVEQNERKRKLLTGERSVRFDCSQYVPPVGENLNTYQKTALVWADGAADVVCIHGPPGTGKTRSLTAYVKYAVQKGNTVLITAHSNQAVDNLLAGESTPDDIEENTLHAMAQDPDQNMTIARAGNNSTSKVVQSQYLNNSVTSADIIAATTSGAAQFDQDRFDVAVVDEATQASRPATAIVLNCAEKLVLAGDHKQLPPFCADEGMQEEDLHISLFEYLLDRYDNQISVLLKKQYRMNEEIAAFPNEAFYDGDLETADQNRNWTISDLKPVIGIDINGDEQRSYHGNSYQNDAEAEAVAKQVKLLVMSGADPGDIGVISAYSGQLGTIGSYVNGLDIENSHRVNVDTVDSFQGGEREAIIVSFVRSNPDGHSGFLEFPEEGPRRLNVALTRARKRLVVVGNWETLGTLAPHRTAEESCAHLYADLADDLRRRGRMKSLRSS
ncbi:DEAD/DEAH box helicase [Halorubrum sp. DTA98]|uniref:DEAD/DEAH box helicase n=1 Tax=Halorubrum sp. DTA98 TaxID=3402163 RepID=UPI003AACC1E0